MKRTKCRYPDCRHDAQATFALIPLCEKHHDIIWRETRIYYSKPRGTVYRTARAQYMRIADQIPWSRSNLEQMDAVQTHKATKEEGR